MSGHKAMEENPITQRYHCAHCVGTGTCIIANGASCGTCIKNAKVAKQYTIVRCGVCMGFGQAEPTTQRFIGRMPVFVVMTVLAVFYLFVAFNADNEARFDQIFPLVGSLTTMIVTFYFSKK